MISPGGSAVAGGWNTGGEGGGVAVGCHVWPTACLASGHPSLHHV